MRVLLTGASGFIGRYVLNQLAQAEIDTIVIGRSRPDRYAGDFIEADLLDVQDWRDLIQTAAASHLIHLAWYVEHGQYWDSPQNFRWVEASLRLVEAFCLAGGQKVVAAGTCAEYDWTFGYCLEEQTPLIPATLYGVAKDSTRRLLEEICKLHQTQFAWGRVFLPYGIGEDSRRLIPSLIDVFKGKRAPFGVNAESYRDFVHVEDVARGFICLLLSDAEGVYNIASGNPTQIGGVVRTIAKAFNANPSKVLELATERPGEPKVLFGNNQKLRMLGWEPKYSIEEFVHSQVLNL
jgi:nucleoside-diphosphate-sugar epimerase